MRFRITLTLFKFINPCPGLDFVKWAHKYAATLLDSRPRQPNPMKECVSAFKSADTGDDKCASFYLPASALIRMRNSSSSILRSVLLGLLLPLAASIYLLLPLPAEALYPSDTQDSINSDLHGQNLQNQEFVKYDLAGFDLSGSDLSGSYFSVTNAMEANLSGANLENVIAYATRFDNADLSDSIFKNAELLKSRFDGAQIDGADFSGANLDLPQQKALCAKASGKNSKTGVDTSSSLSCSELNQNYKGAIPSA